MSQMNTTALRQITPNHRHTFLSQIFVVIKLGMNHRWLLRNGALHNRRATRFIVAIYFQNDNNTPLFYAINYGEIQWHSPGVSNHRQRCSFDILCRLTTTETWKLRITGLVKIYPSVTVGLPLQRATHFRWKRLLMHFARGGHQPSMLLNKCSPL